MALEHVEKRAARIKERREEIGITQEQVADRMHDAQQRLHPDDPPDRTRGQMVSDWERAINNPSPKKVELLAAALDTTVSDLMAGPQGDRSTPPLLGVIDGNSEGGEAPGAIAAQIISELKAELVPLARQLERIRVTQEAVEGRLLAIETVLETSRKSERRAERAATKGT